MQMRMFKTLHLSAGSRASMDARLIPQRQLAAAHDLAQARAESPRDMPSFNLRFSSLTTALRYGKLATSLSIEPAIGVVLVNPRTFAICCVSPRTTVPSTLPLALLVQGRGWWSHHRLSDGSG